MSLSVRELGSGPPVLLVHAGGLDSRMWLPIAERLADRFSLVMPDLRGHGRTPAPLGEFDHAADLLALLDARGIESCPVVGASFGGGIAVDLAGRAADRVSHLVLFAATLFDHQFSEAIERFWAQEDACLAHADIEGAVQLGLEIWVKDASVAELVGAMSRDAFLAQLGPAGAPADPRQDLAAVRCPVLAVSGGLDFPDFAEMADRIAAEVPGAQRAQVEDAGHLIALERPDAAAELLLRFISG